MSNTIFNNITLTKKIKLENKIIMYCGNTLPTGYVWCDGDNGTPNLKGRFIYGINATDNPENIGNSEINSIPNHNHNITANSVTRNIDKVVNNINYQYLNQTRTPNDDEGAQKGNGGAWSHKQHSHQVNNNSSNNNLAQNLGQTLDATINNSTNNNINQEYNNIVNTGVNNNVFDQKYIYIGFIMKV